MNGSVLFFHATSRSINKLFPSCKGLARDRQNVGSPREVRHKKLLAKAIEDTKEKVFVVICLIIYPNARQKRKSLGQFLLEDRTGKECLALFLIPKIQQ
jgi:hypothetical protein